MNPEIEPQDLDLTHRSILEEAGFRKRGCCMVRIIGHQEHRYIQVSGSQYKFEGRFGFVEHDQRSEVTE